MPCRTLAHLLVPRSAVIALACLALADCEEAVARRSRCRAYERLTGVEELLRVLTSEGIAEALFERLKRTYRGKIDTGVFIATWENTQAMKRLLGDWPPIGRKIENLVSIIGAKGKPHKRQDGTDAVRYVIREDLNGAAFSFDVRDGIIRSVWRWGLE